MMDTQVITEIEIYEPTVQDRIQRVLYRLDHGEQLGQKDLYDGQNFCVMGLFADESGLGEWNHRTIGNDIVGNKIQYTYKPHDTNYLSSTSLLPFPVRQYYGFNTATGMFKFSDISDDLRDRIVYIYREFFGRYANKSATPANIYSLTGLNDVGVRLGDASINQVLADLIRSGAAFK